MAYNQQPRHGGFPSPSYRQRPPEDASQPYSPTQYSNVVGDSSFNFIERPQYEPTQQSAHDRYLPQNGDRRHYGGRGQYGSGGRGYYAGRVNDGHIRRNEGRGQNISRGQDGMRARNGDMRRPHGHQRPIDSERRAFVDPRAPGPTPPNHAPFPIYTGGPQDGQIQYQDQHQQSPQVVRYHDFPVDPDFDNEPAEVSSSNYDKEKTYNEPQTYRAFPPPKPYLSNKGANLVNPNERVIINNQNEDYANPYTQGVSSGNSGHNSSSINIDTAQARLVHERPHSRSNESQNAQFHSTPRSKKPAGSTSSDIVSWDSPFPAFPVNKGKISIRNQSNLDKSIGEMSLADDLRGGKRPHTASSKSSQSSSRIGERKTYEKERLDHSEPSSQMALDPGLKFFEDQPGPYPSEHQPSGRPNPSQGLNGTGSMHEVKPFINQDRRSEDTMARPSFHFNGSESGRSKTMPLSISEAVQKDGHQRGYIDQPVWQEPDHNVDHRRRESVEHFQSRPIDPSQLSRTSRPASQPGMTGMADGNEGLNTRGVVSRPPHSAQNSLGDFYDSYYNTSQHDQQSYGQGQNIQQLRSPEEDMPNFDALPRTNTGYSQGMTIDDHLPPQQSLPEPRQSSPQHRSGKIRPSRSTGHIAGQLFRSKSQPNLDDQYSRSHHPNNDFVFDLPGDVPAVPPIAPLKDKFGPQDFQYPNNRDQSIDQEARIRNEYGGKSPFNGPNEGVRPYGPDQQSFQPSERYRSPPPQSEYARDGPSMRPGSRPGSRPNQTNASGPTSPAIDSPANPGVLPPHPVPIRPGLMQGLSHEQSAKPHPIRQYNSGPLEPNSSQQPGAPPLLIAKRDSVPVTLEELERLKQAVKSKPSDQKAQLDLAKKLVEASSVLVDNDGRTDQKAKTKAREKYILDAHKIVKKLVHSNSVDATFYLADCYSRGLLGLEVDTKEAFALYQTAAKAGHAQSAYRVAVCCEMGQDEGGGTRRDPQKAMQWYKRAATLGDTPAMYKIGIIKLKGLLGQPKESQEALIWLRRAADRADEENPHALHELALLHESTNSDQTVAKDEAYSRQLFTQAANLGYKFSQFRLGCAYEYGLMGCPIDPRQSIVWYSKAATQEEHQSELALSGWYLTGSEGVLQQSDTEAYLWARKAAQSGLAKAEYAMGYFTEVGIGAPTNIEDAKRWYWRSASQNFPKARDRLEELRKGGAKMQKSRVSRSAIRKQSEGECVLM